MTPSTLNTHDVSVEKPVAGEKRSGAWIVLTIAVTVFALGGAMGFAFAGGRLLARLDDNTGEILMERGKTLETAGAAEEARTVYEQALLARFESPRNRTYVLKYLGALEAKQQRWEDAVTHLEASLAGPEAPMSAYTPLVEALLAMDRTEEARATLDAWRKAAGEKDVLQVAANEFWRGMLERDTGNPDAAREHFLASLDKAPGNPASVELAQLALARGDKAAAVKYALYFLDVCGSGKDVRRAREIHRKAVE